MSPQFFMILCPAHHLLDFVSRGVSSSLSGQDSELHPEPCTLGVAPWPSLGWSVEAKKDTGEPGEWGKMPEGLGGWSTGSEYKRRRQPHIREGSDVMGV